MAYTYDEFLSKAQASGLYDQFSAYDLETAQKYPEFGLSILKLKEDSRNATSAEQRLLINEAANELRKSYGNYTATTDGSGYVSAGKIPGQIDSKLEEVNGYGSFSYGQSAPTYNNQYADQQQALLDEILNREDFSWTKEEDPQWSPLKKQYLREGERATANALAQASAASGGRPSSHAITAAAQAGDYYATQLNDMISTLYQQAYDRYLDEYSMKVQDLGTLNQQEQLDYAKYLDSLTQYNTDRNFAYQQYLDDFSIKQNQLAALQGQDATDYERYTYENETEYQKALYKAELLASAGDFSGYRALGFSEQEIAKLQKTWQQSEVKFTQTEDEPITTITSADQLGMEAKGLRETFLNTEGWFLAPAVVATKIEEKLDANLISEAEADWLLSQFAPGY